MTNLELLNLLHQVRDRIFSPLAFCRYAPAVDQNGRYVHPKDPKACKWCLLGAVGAEFQGDWKLHRAAVGILWDVTRARGIQNIAHWIDSPSVEHSDVLEVLDEAIAIVSASSASLRHDPGSP